MSTKQYGICKECCQENTFFDWCNACNAKHFQQDFKNWSSNNDNIDKFIQDTQLSAKKFNNVLEWIPYKRFYDIKYIAKGGFGKVYKANWIDGYIWYWDNSNKNWIRLGQNELVALKSLNNSKNITLEFINEIITLKHHLDFVKFYGITQDPETKNYMIVLDYAKNGNLRNYLNMNNGYRSWKDKICDLHKIAYGLYKIHEKDLIHRDLHIGNILVDSYKMYLISDIGLCKPADYNNNLLENTKNDIYGVLPYVAPEILRGQDYTKASDIYSFGIIMYEVISRLPPYYYISHDNNLAIKICKGFRPRFNIKVPQLIVNLIKRCLDANPLNRPTSNSIEKILYQWYYNYDSVTELINQIKKVDEINNNLKTIYSKNIPLTNLNLLFETHSEAIYTSRLLNFNNLPEQKNSDDYYEQNDNIISIEFSVNIEPLQIDVFRSRISDGAEEKK